MTYKEYGHKVLALSSSIRERERLLESVWSQFAVDEVWSQFAVDEVWSQFAVAMEKGWRDHPATAYT